MLEISEDLPPTQQAILWATQYPCENCLLPRLQTIDQLSTFMERRQAQTFIALCWSARVAGYDDPLYSRLKDKSISRNFYDWAHLKTSYLEALWGLCQILAPMMADELRRLGDEDIACLINALFLFKAALIEKENGSIELSFGYVEISGRKVDEALKLKAKSIKEGLTQKELRRLRNLAKGNGYRDSHFMNLLSFMVLKNLKSRAVVAQFELFSLASANLWEKEATMARKNGCWGWNNGVKIAGSQTSVYTPVLSES